MAAVLRIRRDEMRKFLPVLSEWLGYKEREKPLTTADVSEAAAILCPDVPLIHVKKSIYAYYMALHHLVYIEKHGVQMPNIGTIFSRFRPRRKIKFYNTQTGEVEETISRAKWSFRFRSHFMDRSLYKKNIAAHKASAEKYGYEHDDMAFETYQNFCEAYELRTGKAWEYEDEEALREYREFKKARKDKRMAEWEAEHCTKE